MRHVAELNPPSPSKAKLPDDAQVSFLPMEAIGDDGSIQLDSSKPAGELRGSYSYFADGDVAFAKVTPCFENGKGALMRGLVGGVGFGTTELTVLRPKVGALDRRFLHYFIVSPAFRGPGAGSMTGAGGLKRVPDEFTRNTPIPLPPLEVQAAIANFLDRETARIDALIDKKTRFIELLREKRQTLITHAIARGTDLSASLRDSGIEAIGQVPTHYEMTRLMHGTDSGRDIMYGIVLPGPDVGDGIPIVKGGNVKRERLKLEDLCRTTAEIEAPYARARLRPDDIVYSIRGSIGDAELVPPELKDANITQDVARVSPGPRVNARWLLYALKSTALFAQLDQEATGATIRGINIASLKRAALALPPLDEQASVVEFVDGACERLDRISKATERSIDLLRERRAALIAAAVTGQIDVRDGVPAEEQPEPA